MGGYPLVFRYVDFICLLVSMKDAASSPVKIKVIMESPDVGARTLGVNCQHQDQSFKLEEV